MTTTQTTPGRLRGTVAPGPHPLREALGRAHYERMRREMGPGFVIAPWEDLSPASREAYRRRLDYLVPDVLTVIADELALGRSS